MGNSQPAPVTVFQEKPPIFKVLTDVKHIMVSITSDRLQTPVGTTDEIRHILLLIITDITLKATGWGQDRLDNGNGLRLGGLVSGRCPAVEAVSGQHHPELAPKWSVSHFAVLGMQKNACYLRAIQSPKWKSRWD
ncbi:MAG: hypothetical protein PVG51_01895 [Desulfosarcina sp.]